MGTSRFISEPVDLQWCPNSAAPCAFVWRGQRYAVQEIVSDGRVIDPNPRWYLRRHRRRLVVRADDGGYYELYALRPKHWILYRELDDPLA